MCVGGCRSECVYASGQGHMSSSYAPGVGLHKIHLYYYSHDSIEHSVEFTI